jgi:hypothetical protein
MGGEGGGRSERACGRDRAGRRRSQYFSGNGFFGQRKIGDVDESHQPQCGGGQRAYCAFLPHNYFDDHLGLRMHGRIALACLAARGPLGLKYIAATVFGSRSRQLVGLCTVIITSLLTSPRRPGCRRGRLPSSHEPLHVRPV